MHIGHKNTVSCGGFAMQGYNVPSQIAGKAHQTLQGQEKKKNL